MSAGVLEAPVRKHFSVLKNFTYKAVQLEPFFLCPLYLRKLVAGIIPLQLHNFEHVLSSGYRAQLWGPHPG